MSFGIRFDTIKICANVIIDGHHGYVSSLIAGIAIETSKSHRTSATIEYDWCEDNFVDTEWDRPEEILYWNQLDAGYNKIPFEKILKITE